MKPLRASLALAFVQLAWAQTSPPAPPVMVIVNLASTPSRQIAEYYARRRAIPPTQVCSIRCATGETVTRAEYEQTIENPVRACLDSNALSGKPIHYLVLTAGQPLRVSGTAERNGTLASVDSELALLYQRRQGKVPPLEGATPNPFFGKTYVPFDQRAYPLYMVARLAAYDWPTVKRMIDHAMEAANRGRVVLDLKENETDNPGDRWLASAALQLPRARVEIDSTRRVVTGEKGVIGYAGWGSNDPNRTQRRLGFEWLPGSAATEYVSTNGRTLQRPPDSWAPGRNWRNPATLFSSSPQTLAADYLAEGATAATAHTDEPYLSMTPRPDMLLPAYLNGRTLGESYYLSIAGLGWRNILLGDPLCRLGQVSGAANSSTSTKGKP